MSHPPAKSKWKYVGPGIGGGIHTVLAQILDTEVVTCSNPSAAGGGFSWLGSIEDFYKNFVRA